MNPNSRTGTEGGSEAARSVESSSHSSGTELQDGMKRAAVKQLIEAYYSQLTDGCGNDGCLNEICASNPNFVLKDRDKNRLAIEALELFKKKAQLCDNQRRKVAKLLDTGENSELVSPVKSTASCNVHLDLPGPSTSGATGGAIAKKSPATTPSGKGVEIAALTEEKLQEIISDCEKASSWSLLIKTIGSVFRDPDILIKSFVKTVDTAVLKEQIKSMEGDDDKDVDEKEDAESGEIIPTKTRSSSSESSSHEITVDLDSLRRSYLLLNKIPDQPFERAFINALMALSGTLVMDLKYSKQLEKQPNYLNIFVIIMELPFLHSPAYIENAYPEFCKTIGCLPLAGQVQLAKFWSQFGAKRLKQMIVSLQQLITVKIIDGEEKWAKGYHINNEDSIANPTRVMKILYYASLYGGEQDPSEILEEEKNVAESEDFLQNELLGASAMGFESKEFKQPKDDPLGKELKVSHMECRTPLVPYEDFVNESLNDYINVETDFKYKLEADEGKFSFVNYSFIMNTASKQMSLYMDNRIRMFSERRSSILQTLIHGLPPMPFLRIRVSRDRIIDDALVALEMVAMENPSDLKKQLFVEFDGEQGIDEGGLTKEFFQLVIEEIFNVDFGMFTYNEETRQFWFNPTSFENDAQFTLIGVVLGLAIYNSTIVDVHFPAVVYRKLMGKKGVFEDLGDVDPVLYKSLCELKEYTGDDIEDVFMQTFRIAYKDIFGSALTHDLKDKGDTIAVTQENKMEFITLYADFLLNKSIEKQFRAFRRGFQMVTNESPLRSLFRPKEIELLICGSDQFDFFALEGAAEYDGGFDKNSRTIKNFWDIVHDFSEDHKRKLLQFTTGTDRVPVGGLSKLKLIIAKNGPDSDRLPTAHTCFNVLLLPDYTTKAKLEERLLKAINYSKGFGML